MKRLKWLLFTTMILSIVGALTGCVIIPVSKYYDIDVDIVESVEIYDLTNRESDNGDFHATEAPIYTLSEEQMEPFFSDLADIQFEDHLLIVIAAVDPSFHYGDWVARINYKDGTFFLLSCDGYTELYDENGLVVDVNHFGCDDREWEAFLSAYLPQN